MAEENENPQKEKKSENNPLVPIISVVLIGSFLSSYLTANFMIKKLPGIETKKESHSNESIHLTYYKLGDFIVNLANKEVNRYLKTDITLGVILGKSKKGGHGDGVDIIKEKEAILRDIIIEKLSSYTSQQLHSVEGRRKLKKDILDGLNEANLDFKVKKIFFNSFMMQ